MAMTGVLRPGHAQIRVLDLEESVKWYTEVMGLVPMGRDQQGIDRTHQRLQHVLPDDRQR